MDATSASCEVSCSMGVGCGLACGSYERLRAPEKLGRIRLRCPDAPLQNQLVFTAERILPGLVAECQPWAAQKARICAESSCWASYICRLVSLVIVVPVGG